MNADRSTAANPASPPAGDAGPLTTGRFAGPATQPVEPGPLPRLDIDPQTGRLLPISDEEWAARMEDLTRLLDEIDAADDDPPELFEQFMRNVDEERRRQGRPPAFEGYFRAQPFGGQEDQS
jgi:hypothetical protein